MFGGPSVVAGTSVQPCSHWQFGCYISATSATSKETGLISGSFQPASEQAEDRVQKLVYVFGSKLLEDCQYLDDNF